jgi:hypothetical protein
MLSVHRLRRARYGKSQESEAPGRELLRSAALTAMRLQARSSGQSGLRFGMQGGAATRRALKSVCHTRSGSAERFPVRCNPAPKKKEN